MSRQSAGPRAGKAGLATELVRADPVKYAALARAGKGCATMLAVVLGVTGALLALAWAWGWPIVNQPG